MPITELKDVQSTPFQAARRFGDVGSFTQTTATAVFAVDPAHVSNAAIVDLALAARDANGLVSFTAEICIVQPATPGAGNGAALVQVPNRGRAPFVTIGDEHLQREGWTLAACAWQWDVPDEPGRMTFRAPEVRPDARDPSDAMQLRLQPFSDAPDLVLTDQHVGVLGNHIPIRSADLDATYARLLERDHPLASPREIPRSEWAFARDDAGVPQPDDTRIWRRGGFTAGQVYDVIYHPLDCPVVGTGLLAIRDFGRHLKLAAGFDDVIACGTSQCGRFLRTYLYHGLNLGEDGAQSYDGILANVAGGRRGEFNMRYGQPSVQTTPGLGHGFPFADDAQADPVSGRQDGLLTRQRALGGTPRIIYTDTAPEYWRGDASLTHTDLVTGNDLELPGEVRRYLFASAQHPGGQRLELTRDGATGAPSANYMNLLDWSPLLRGALINLLAWIRGAEPPPSQFPRHDNRTAARRESVLAQLARITTLTLPEASLLNHMYAWDLGAHAANGIGRYPPVPVGQPYPCLVSALDDNGNETGGIRLPDVEAPLGVHAGINPRHVSTGGKGLLSDYVGSTAPWSPPAISSRYGDRDQYLALVRERAAALAQMRYIVGDDIETCVINAARNWDIVITSAG